MKKVLLATTCCCSICRMISGAAQAQDPGLLLTFGGTEAIDVTLRSLSKLTTPFDTFLLPPTRPSPKATMTNP